MATGSQSVQPVSADTSGSYGALVERANGLYDQGAAAFDAKQYDQGAAYFEAAAKVYAAAWKQQSTDPGVGTDYATSLFYSARIEPAISQIEKVLAQSPEFQTAWFNKGNYLAEKARQADEDGDAKTAKAAFADARVAYQKAVSLDVGLGLGPAGPAASGRAAQVDTGPACSIPGLGDARRRRELREAGIGVLHQRLAPDGLEDIRRQSRATVPPRALHPGVCWAPEEAPPGARETGEHMDHQSGEGERMQVTRSRRAPCAAGIPGRAASMGSGDAMVELLPEITQALKLTPAERAARGKAARKKAPRSAHARWEAPAGRPDPVGLLEEQAADRVADLVPIRYGRMLVSPGTFYRGGALLMASDLAGTPDSGLTAQLCGDAHLMNFGLFQSPERRLVFDINDFDETLPGPWEWDVKRLAASFEIAARDHGYAAPTRRSIVMHSVRAYREAMLEMAEKRAIQLWYTRLDADLIRDHVASLGGKDAKRMAKDMSRAEMKHDLRALSRLTAEVEGKPRLRSDPPLLVPARELLEGDERARFTHAVEEALRTYRETLPKDRRARTTSTATGRWRARSSASAASAPAPGSCCSSAGTRATRCSCRPSRRRPPCWSASSGAAGSATPAGAWSRASG